MLIVTVDENLIHRDAALKIMLTATTKLRRSLFKSGLLHSQHGATTLEFTEAGVVHAHALVDSAVSGKRIRSAAREWNSNLPTPFCQDVGIQFRQYRKVFELANYMCKTWTVDELQGLPEGVKSSTRRFSASPGFGIIEKQRREQRVELVRFEVGGGRGVTLSDLVSECKSAIKKRGRTTDQTVTLEIRNRLSSNRVCNKLDVSLADLDHAVWKCGYGESFVLTGEYPVIKPSDLPTLHDITTSHAALPKVLRAVFRWIRENPTKGFRRDSENEEE